MGETRDDIHRGNPVPRGVSCECLRKSPQPFVPILDSHLPVVSPCSSWTLCGGSSLFTGFEGRFKTELLRRLGPEAHVVVVAQANRNLSVWIGGSILASLCAFQTRWVLREQYEEHGPDIVLRKCS